MGEIVQYTGNYAYFKENKLEEEKDKKEKSPKKKKR